MLHPDLFHDYYNATISEELSSVLKYKPWWPGLSKITLLLCCRHNRWKKGPTCPDTVLQAELIVNIWLALWAAHSIGPRKTWLNIFHRFLPMMTDNSTTFIQIIVKNNDNWHNYNYFDMISIRMKLHGLPHLLSFILLSESSSFNNCPHVNCEELTN